MKALVSLSAVCLSLGLTAQAMPAPQEIRVVLQNVQSNAPEERGNVAVITVDKKDKQMKFELYNDSCGQFSMNDGQVHCMAAATLVQSIQAPLVKTTTECASLVYTAKTPVDIHTADGFNDQIIFKDHTKRICTDVVEADYVVDAKRTGGFAGVIQVYHASGNLVPTKPMPKPEVKAKDDSEIYAALSIAEKDVTPAGLEDISYFSKISGRLLCKKSSSYEMVAGSGAMVDHVACELSELLNGTSDKEIYQALNVKEVYAVPAGVLGVSKFEKKAGRLTCTKSSVVYPNAPISYSCTLTAK